MFELRTRVGNWHGGVAMKLQNPKIRSPFDAWIHLQLSLDPTSGTCQILSQVVGGLSATTGPCNANWNTPPPEFHRPLHCSVIARKQVTTARLRSPSAHTRCLRQGLNQQHSSSKTCLPVGQASRGPVDRMLQCSLQHSSPHFGLPALFSLHANHTSSHDSPISVRPTRSYVLKLETILVRASSRDRLIRLMSRCHCVD